MDFNDRRSNRYSVSKAVSGSGYPSMSEIEDKNLKVPVCRGCGEAFEHKGIAEQAHGKMGCGTETGERGYKMTKYSEAF